MKINDDLERGLKKEDYDRTIKEFLYLFKEKKYVLSVGQFGSVTYPGISDLDMFLLVKKNSLKQTYKDYQSWVESEGIKKYCFFHPPVISTTSTIKYLSHTHTMYDFRILENKTSDGIDIKCKNRDLLNLMWITFLIPIINNILNHNEKNSARKNLLVLKNLHQSEVNFGGRSNAIHVSNKLRGEALKKNNSLSAFEEIKKTINNIFNLLDKRFDEGQLNERKVSFNISREVELIRSDSSYFRNGNIYLNKHLYDRFVKTLFWNRSPAVIENYYKILRKYSQEERREGITPSFVKPFGYPFYKNPVITFAKSTARKYFL